MWPVTRQASLPASARALGSDFSIRPAYTGKIRIVFIYSNLFMLLGDIVQDEGEEDERRSDTGASSLGVQIKMYTVHPK